MPLNVAPAKRLRGPNPPGLVQVLLIPADAVQDMPVWLPGTTLAVDIPIDDSKPSYAFFVADIGGEFATRQRLRTEGPGVELEAEFNYIGLPESLDPIFSTLAGREALLVATTHTGAAYLLGTKERPLSIEVRKSTGSIGGMYGYSLRLKGIALQAPPLFTGTLSGTPVVVTPPPTAENQDFSKYDFTHYDFY